jgi:hypothetical protein
MTVDPGRLQMVIPLVDVPITDQLMVRKRVFVAQATADVVQTNPREHDDRRWCAADEVNGFLRWDSNRTTSDAVTATPEPA